MRARAQATVEVAVVFPLLVLLMLALVQFAIYVHARNVVVTAVQEGAHVAAALSGSPEAGEDRARTLLRAGLGRDLRDRIEIDRPFTVREDQPDEAVRMVARGSYRTFLRFELPLDATAEVSLERFRAPR